MRISIVIPVFNEEANIGPLAAELDQVMAGLGDAEAIFVDDGSSDGTWANIQACAKRFSGVRGLRAPQNRGQSASLLSGIADAKGDIIVTMDGDMQSDPTDIPGMLEALEDTDCVLGYRAKRKDTWSRRAASRLANKIRRMVTHDGAIDTGCSLRAFKRECAADLPRLNGMHRFMPAHFTLNGRKIKQIPVHHRARAHGSSKYTNLKRLPVTVKDLMGFHWYRRRYLADLSTEKTSDG